MSTVTADFDLPHREASYAAEAEAFPPDTFDAALGLTQKQAKAISTSLLSEEVHVVVGNASLHPDTMCACWVDTSFGRVPAVFIHPGYSPPSFAVVHEVAHLAADRNGSVGHDDVWRAHYLGLLARVNARGAARLSEQFASRGLGVAEIF